MLVEKSHTDAHVEGVASLVASLRGASRLERRCWAAGDPYDDDDDDYDYSGGLDGAVAARNSSRGDRSERVVEARETERARARSSHVRQATRYRATPVPRRRGSGLIRRGSGLARRGSAPFDAGGRTEYGGGR